MAISMIIAEIVVVAVIYATIAFFLQRKVSNIKRVNEIRKTVNQHQKDLNEMIKTNAAKADIEKKQQEMMSMLSESMKYQMKGMFIVVPMFLLIYYVALPYVFGGVTGTIATIFSINLTYQTLFVASAFVCGIVLLILVSVVDKIKDKAKISNDNTVVAENAKA